MRIIIDAMGGDNAPSVNVYGAVKALSHRDDLMITLVGQEDVIRALLNETEYDESRIDIVNTTQVISNEDHPAKSILAKKDSSIVVGLKMLRDHKADAFISAGSTGALLAGSSIIVKPIKGVMRPALATLLPTETGSPVMLLDSGANVDAKPEHLLQYAIMASVYMDSVQKTVSPRVGLLNVGTEEGKGNALTKETYPLLSGSSLNFIGNVEGRDVLSGICDIIVCDAFAGNVLLKTVEGFAKGMFSTLKKELTSSFFKKILAGMLKKSFTNIKKQFDYAEYGGAPLLGISECVVKAHGSSNSRAIECAITQAEHLIDAKVVETLKNNVELLSI